MKKRDLAGRYRVECGTVIKADFGEADKYAAIGFAQSVARTIEKDALVLDTKTGATWMVDRMGEVVQS